MKEAENIGAFLRDNSRLAREWIEGKMEFYRLSAIRFVARIGAQLAWTVISLFIIFLLLIFAGITAGFWLSSLTGNYVSGFGIVTGILVLVLLLLAAFRKKLFLNPIIRALASEPVKKEKPGESS